MKKNSKRILRLLRKQYHSLSPDKNIIDNENEEISIDSDDTRFNGSEKEIPCGDSESEFIGEAIVYSNVVEPIEEEEAHSDDGNPEIIASYRSDSGLEFLESDDIEK